MNTEKELCMRHPLWLVNSSLLFLLVAVTGITFFWEIKTPRRVKLELKNSSHQSLSKPTPIDIKTIYENDLFNTYHKMVIAPVEPDYTIPMPTPPSQVMGQVPDEPKQSFLEPLDIKLQGVISLSDQSNNIAMILDKQTTEQANYKVGDMIKDARLIRVFSNHIILIRSNGQQEAIYLNEKDIENDPAYKEEQSNWIHVVKSIDDTRYLIDPETFVGVTKNLAQCIDILDLTTVYRQGKSIGCRIGNIENDSLGSAMGLKLQDIISHIDDLPITTQDERFKAYEYVLNKRFGDSIILTGTREEDTLTITYRLHDLKDPLDESLHELQKEETLPGVHEQIDAEDVLKQKENLLRNKYKFAPTLQDLQAQQRQAMLNQGKREKK